MMPFLLVALLITAAVIFIAWRGVRGGSDGPGGTPAVRPKPRPRPMAPDDDPDFLGEIDRKLHGEDKSS